MAKSAHNTESPLSTILGRNRESLEESLIPIFEEYENSLHLQRGAMSDLSEFAGIIEAAGGLARVKECAAESGTSVNMWIKGALVRATQPMAAAVSIESETYERLKQLAFGRSITVDTLTQGKAFTDMIRRALDNHFI